MKITIYKNDEKLLTFTTEAFYCDHQTKQFEYLDPVKNEWCVCDYESVVINNSTVEVFL